MSLNEELEFPARVAVAAALPADRSSDGRW